MTANGMVLLVVIWGVSEFHNAGGWPTKGFSQSSGIPHVWNMWIAYPILGLTFLTVVNAWSVFARKPISEREIEKEIERQGGTH